MSQIVAATDFSTRSQRALRLAGRLARQTAAELTLVHVVDDDQPEALVELERREANKFLTEQIGSLAELRGLHCRAMVTTGEAFDGILKTAKSTSADLIVMGSHRKHILRDIFVGTTHRTRRPHRTLSGPDGEYGHRTSLSTRHRRRGYVGSFRAIKTAKALGRVDDANLTIVHAFIAVAKGKLYVANASKDQIDDYVARERMQAGEELFAFLTAQGLQGPRWSHRVDEGGAFEVISHVVEETVPDLVVIGTHGRSGIVKMLIGSVAEEALRSLDVDILAVPPAR